jgi:hypothetical protein
VTKLLLCVRGEDGFEARADSGVARELGGAAGGMKLGPDLSVLSTGRGGRDVRLLMQRGEGKRDDEDATSDIHSCCRGGKGSVGGLQVKVRKRCEV